MGDTSADHARDLLPSCLCRPVPIWEADPLMHTVRPKTNKGDLRYDEKNSSGYIYAHH